jgi:hypothetical protein
MSDNERPAFVKVGTYAIGIANICCIADDGQNVIVTLANNRDIVFGGAEAEQLKGWLQDSSVCHEITPSEGPAMLVIGTGPGGATGAVEAIEIANSR